MNEDNKKRKSAIRYIAVIFAIIVVGIWFAISYRVNYLNVKEIGEQYTSIVSKNVKNNLSLAGGIFVISYIVIYVSNKFIKHGLKKFFNEDKKEMPKLPNKTFAIIGGLISAIMGTVMLSEKYTMFISMAFFGKSDPIFNTDIGFYVFSLPFIESVIFFAIGLLVCVMIYTAIYYVIAMNTYLDGVDIEVLKKNTFIKQIVGIITVIALLISVYIFVTSENILTQDMLKVDGKSTFELTGAGKTDVTLKLWGYRIFAVILFFSIVRLLKYARRANFKQVMVSISIIPVYLVILFVSMVYYDQFIVKSEVLDNQKEYIGYNISNTKEAYGINVEQQSIENYDTIGYDEISDNADVIENIPIISKDIMVSNVSEHQENGVYYSYNKNFLSMLRFWACVYNTSRNT